jgi:carboxypeptidase Taq
VGDIPSYWNQRYADYLGVKVPNDRQGCLQDVHWSHGSLGYFPTYSLGSFYGAQLFLAAENQDNTIPNAIGEGNTGPLLNWLRQHVHRHGRRYTSEELCRQATGQPLDIQYFLHYLLDKYNKIYNF